MEKITTTSNFDFIQSCFIESKLAAKAERKQQLIDPTFEDPDRLKGIGLEGASRTGKSWDISVFICHYVSTYEGKLITIARDHLATLKDTFYETLKKVWKRFGFPMRHFNKTASDIHFNGNIIRFVGINDDIMKAHGYESDLLVINEALGADWGAINQMEQRANEFFIYDYNPSSPSARIYKKEKEPSYRLHKTTIFDNIYAPANAKAKIVSYAHPNVDDFDILKNKVAFHYTREEWKALKERNVLLETADEYMWKVYGLGTRAVGEDIIFPKWKTYSEEPEDSTLDWAHCGGDFGFTSDPVACIKVKKQGKNLYLRERFFVPDYNPSKLLKRLEKEDITDEDALNLLTHNQGLTNPEIAELMHFFDEADELSIWDRAEEKSITELIEADVTAWYSDKGPGSVAFGIQKMKQFNIFIHEDSHNLQFEFERYRWAKNKDGSYKRNQMGKRIPIDKDNHGIDSVRYVLLYYYWVQNEESTEEESTEEAA